MQVQVPPIRLPLRKTSADVQREIVLLIDDSGSVNDGDFALMRNFCQQLTGILKDEKTASNVRFGAICFASDASVVSTLNDAALVTAEINKYVRKRGSTNLIAALKQAGVLLSASRVGAKKEIFVLTDGGPDADPFQAANSIKDENVTIYAVGIGAGVTFDNLQRFATAGCIFQVKNFVELRDLSIRPPQERLVEMNVTCRQCTAFGQPLILTLQITNIGSELSQLKIFFSPKSYFQAGIGITKEMKIAETEEVTMEVKLSATGDEFEKVPNDIPFKIVEKKNERHVECRGGDAVLLASDLFVSGFVNYPAPSPQVPSLNLLMFGVIGAGKSSFINTIITSLQRIVNDPASVGGQTDHVTHEFRSYPLNQFLGLGDCRISLWDTWGVDESNYKSDFLIRILAGEIPDGFEMKSVNITGGIPRQISYNDANARRIHGVFLFVPVGILMDETLCLRVKEILKQTNLMGLNATLIVTRADTILNPDRLQVDIAVKFSVPQNRVYMVSNYVKSRTKDFNIDKRTLDVFNDVVTRAQTYHDQICRRPSLISSPQRPLISSPKQEQQPIQKVYLCLPGSTKSDAKGVIRNVQPSSSASSFKERVISELGDSFAAMTFTESKLDAQPVSTLVNSDGIISIAFPSQQQSQKIVVMKEGNGIGVIKAPHTITLPELRQKIKAELNLSSFAFCDEGIAITPVQEKQYTAKDIIQSNNQVTVK